VLLILHGHVSKNEARAKILARKVRGREWNYFHDLATLWGYTKKLCDDVHVVYLTNSLELPCIGTVATLCNALCTCMTAAESVYPVFLGGRGGGTKRFYMYYEITRCTGTTATLYNALDLCIL
jgi:hypothetical protein